MKWANSKRKATLVRVLLLILTVSLIFGGPTYAVYILRRQASLPYIVAVLVGLLVFTIGISLFLHLIVKKTKLGASE
jgi:hypothetical protein